jgi:hypothetical protein
VIQCDLPDCLLFDRIENLMLAGLRARQTRSIVRASWCGAASYEGLGGSDGLVGEL